MIRIWKRLNYFKKGLAIILISVVFNFLETWFFGWNLHAKSVAEGFCDMFSSIGINAGLFLIAAHVTGSMIIEWVEEELRER